MMLIGDNLEKFLMKPLPQWTILAIELNNLLSDNTSQERTNWRDLSLTEFSYTIDKFLFNLINLKLKSLLTYFIFLPL